MNTSLDLTAKEREAIEADDRMLRLMMEAVDRANGGVRIPLQSLFETAEPVTGLFQWTAGLKLSDTARMKLAIRDGADVNQTMHGSSFVAGYTPLHHASENGRIAHVRLLLAHGADIEARTATGERPEDLTREKFIVELIREERIRRRNRLRTASSESLPPSES